MVNRKTNKAIKKNKKTRKMYKQHKHKTKGGDPPNDTITQANDNNTHKPTYNKMGVDVIITKGEDEKRKLEFNVRSFYHFYDYLNEVDMFLKNTLNEELLAFTDPNKYAKWKTARKTKIYSYNYGYEPKEKKEKKGIKN